MFRVVLLLFGFFLTQCSCTKQVPIDKPIHKGFYAYVCTTETECVVTAVSLRYFEIALEELGCVKSICRWEQRGNIYVVERTKD